MKQLTELERHLLEALTKLRKDQNKQTRNELKKFEKDLLFFMQDKGMDEVVGGRIHFRCISCDQQAPSEWGHASTMFKQAVGKGVGAHVGAGVLAAPKEM